MNKFEYVQGLDIPFQIVSYTSSKSVKLYIKKGYIKVTKPTWYRKKDVIEYIQKNSQSISKMYCEKMEKMKEYSLLEQGYIFLLGEKYDIKLEEVDGNQAYIEFDQEEKNVYISVPFNLKQEQIEEVISKLVNSVYRKYAQVLVNNSLIKYSKLMGILISNFKVKKCKSIWGSCSSKGNLNFNIKVAMLPQYIIDNIVVHELCHIKHKNHGPKFWDMVYHYCTKEQYMKGEKWIKDNITYTLDF